jgi:hypothetical protein
MRPDFRAENVAKLSLDETWKKSIKTSALRANDTDASPIFSRRDAETQRFFLGKRRRLIKHFYLCVSAT